MKKSTLKSSLLTVAVGAGLTAAVQAAPAPQVYVNGQVLPAATSPINQNGRVLVPLRAIFERLGANVNYNSLNESIAAKKGTTSVRMALNTRKAMVNNIPVTLDVPARTYGGITYVPLRFVSEALGANVDYNSYQRLVSIRGTGYSGGTGSQVAGYRQITVPANVVVPVTLDQELSSKTAYRGQKFTATVVSDTPGDSEFPSGTRLEGTVTEAQPKEGKNPGVLDLSFRNAILPNGSRIALNGGLTNLDSDSVKETNGRLVANGKKKNDSLKVIGIGAGAGFLIGRVLKQNDVVSALLGAAGGYLYNQSRDGKKASDARLTAGTKFGVVLRNSVTYTDSSGYYDVRSRNLRM